MIYELFLNVLLFLGLVFGWPNSAPKEIKPSGTEIFSIFLNVILFTWGVVQLIDTNAVERFYKDIEIKEKREANEKETQAMFKRIRKNSVTLPAASSGG